MLKRIFSLFLCLVLLVSAVPVTVFADGADGGDISVEDVLPTEPAQTEPPTAPAETEPSTAPTAVPTEPGHDIGKDTEPTNGPEDPPEPTVAPDDPADPVDPPEPTVAPEDTIAGTIGNLQWAFDPEVGYLSIWGEGAIPDFDYNSDNHWLAYREEILAIEIAEGVGEIGMYAFKDCGNVRDIYIPQSVVGIYHNAFDGWSSTDFHVYTDSCGESVAESLGFPIVYRDAPIEPPTEPEFPVSGSCGPDASWNLDKDSGTLTISGNGAMNDFDPAPWYVHRYSIFTVIIEEGITHVGTYAFLECSSLTDIYFPESVESIAASAFTDCAIPTCWVYWGSDAQYYLEELGIPVEFRDEPIEPPTEPGGDVIAEGEAGSLTWRITQDGLLEIMGEGWMDFYYQNDPAPWTQYADQVTSLKISEGVVFLSGLAFVGLKITEAVIPEGVEYVQPDTFVDCDRLKTVYYPSTAKGMHAVFNGCDALQTICVAEGNPNVYDEDGVGMRTWENTLTLCQYPIGRPDKAYVVPQGVTHIGNSAFQGAKNLEDVTLPQSLQVIQDLGFAESGLTDITIPENVTFISYYAFADCADLQELTFTGDLVEIAFGAFDNIEATAYYPADNATWTEDALQNYGGQITWVAKENAPAEDLIAKGESGDLTWKITKAGELVFEGEGWLDFYYEGKPAPWKAYADQITDVSIPGTLKSLGFRVFEGLNKLTQITVPEGVEILSFEAFYNCENLKTVYLPSTLQHTDAPFISCDKLENIYVAEGNPVLYDENGVAMLTRDGRLNLFAYPIGRPKESYAVAEGVQRIAGYAFFDANLKEVTLPQSLTEIGEHAFEQSALETVTVPENVTFISYYAFANCGDLKTIEFTGDLVEIGAEAFINVVADAYYPADNATWTEEARAQFGEGLTWIPKGKPMPDGWVDYGQCGEDVSWVLQKDGALVITGFGAMVDDMSEVCPWEAYRDQVKQLIFEGNITRLSHHAFKEMSGLTEVNLPGTVEFIGEATFGSCTGLTELVIPEGVKGIATSAFAQCTGLTKVTFPASLEVVGGCFYGCTALKEVEFLGDAPDINFELFCDLTVTAYYPGDNATWTEDKLQNYGGNVTWIPREKEPVEIIAEGEAGSLTWRLTEDGLLEIMGQGWMDFYYEDDPAPWTMYAAQITQLKISKGVTFLSGMAFQNLKITEVTIPEGVEYVQPETFYNCDLLKTVYYPSTALGMHAAFYSCDSLENIYVAKGSQWLYDQDGVGLRKWEDTLTLCQYPIGRADESYTVPQGVTHIGQGAFQEADNLKTVKLPQSLTMLDVLSFAESGLEEVTIPGNVTFISYLAFRDCSDLQELTFTGDLVEIADNAFKGVKAKAYYPKDNATWTKAARKNYGGKITWVAMEALPCDHVNVTHVPGKAATCTESGVLEHWSCGDCGQLWLDEALTQKTDKVTQAAAHDLTHVPYKRPTEDADGNKEHWYCERCSRVWTDAGLTQESSFEMVVIPAGTEVVIRPLTLVPMIGQPAQVVENADGSYTVYLDKEDVAQDAVLFSIMAEAFDDQGNSLALGQKDLKWTTSDSRIATVKQDKYMPIGNVTVKKGAQGACVITALNTRTKDETSVTIHVRSYEPRLGSTALSLNAYAWEGAFTDLVPSYGNGIETVSLHEAQGKGYAQEASQRFVPAYDSVEQQLVITLNEIVKKGTHKLLLKVSCENGETYEYKLSMKVTQTLPSVTVKQIGKFNTFYADSVAQFRITAKGGDLLWAQWETQSSPAFRSDYEPETGILTLHYSDAYLEGTVPFKAKGTIEFQFEDYRLPVEKSITVKTEKKAPKLALTESSTVINTAITDDYYTAFLVYDPLNGEIVPGENIWAEASFADCYVDEYDIVNVQLYGKKGGTVNVYVRKDNWTEAVKLTHKVTVKTQLPKLELSQKAIKLNTYFPDVLAYQGMWLDQSNVYLADYYVEIVGKSESVLDEGSKILFQFGDGYIVMKLDPENLPKKGTYEFYVTGILPNGTELAPKSFKVTVEDKLPTVKLKNANLKLNRTLESFAWAETELVLPKGYEEYAVMGVLPNVDYDDFGIGYDPETGKLRVELLSADAVNTTLMIHPVLVHLPSGEKHVMQDPIPLKVTVFNGKPSVSVSAKGKLDAIVPDSAIVYTIKKLTNIAGVPEAVTLAGQDAAYFDARLLEDGSVELTIARGAPVQKNKTYKLELVYTIAGQQVAAKISVKVNQSALKVAAPKALNLYQSNGRLGCVLEVTAPEGASIADIRLSTKTAKQFMNAVEDVTFTELPDGRVLVSFKVSNPGYLTWGKSYNVFLDVIPDGNAGNVKPASVKLTVKTFK